ncbi:MAG: class I SAM-dependent methyltransferase [Planctomycetota bacterium]
MPEPVTIAIAFDKPRQSNRATQLAEQLALPLAQRLADPHDLHLCVAHVAPDQPDRLELRLNPHPRKQSAPANPKAHGYTAGARVRLNPGKPVYPNPQSLDTTSPAGRKLNAPLFKAVGVRKGDPARPRVLDATAGFGEDAWLLAAAGCPVTAYERHPVVHALLEDALGRAKETHPEIATRITLCLADLLTPAGQKPEPQIPTPGVVYLDPMFPPGRKTAEKKPMRLLRMIVGNNDDADALLDHALRLLSCGNGGRVVVKRPRHAPPLSGRTPVHSHGAKALRYDVYAAIERPC